MNYNVFIWRRHSIKYSGDLNAFGIYAICNIANDNEYIGDTWGPFAVRWKQHLCDLEDGHHHCRRLQEDWNTFGRDRFVFIVLEACETEESVWDREYVWVAKRHGDDWNRLYNIRTPRGYIKPKPPKELLFQRPVLDRDTAQEVKLLMLAEGLVYTPETVDDWFRSRVHRDYLDYEAWSGQI